MIVFLNGASSAGKSSVAGALLPLLPEPYFLLGVDAVNSMRSRERTLALGPDALADVLERTVLGFHRVVAGMAAAGNGVVVDHVLRERHWLLDCLSVLDGHDVVFVGVRCPLAELERRERERGDRQIGRARVHFERVHAHGQYDVEVDTSELSPRECAERIAAHVAAGPGERAFDRLRAQLREERR